MQKYLFRTSSTGYAIITVDDNEDMSIKTFRDDRGMSAWSLIVDAKTTPVGQCSYWYLEIAQCSPVKVEQHLSNP